MAPGRAVAHDLGLTNSAVVLRDFAKQNVGFGCFLDLKAVEKSSSRSQVTLQHEEKMLVINVKQKKLKTDYEITQTGQHYAFFIAVTAIGTLGSGMGFFAGKKMLTRSMENLGKQTESEEIGRY